MGKKRFVITVARQFGSLGRPIAKRMAEKLDVEFYDRDLVEKAAEKLKLPVSVIEEYEEGVKEEKTNPFFNMMFPLGRSGASTKDKIFDAQKNIIEFLADTESCVIVGRCSDFILSEYENAMHVFIYAPYPVRVENCVNELKIERDEAHKMIDAVDKARDEYHMNYAGYMPDDKNHKDILIDSSFLGIDGTVEHLVQAARMKFGL